MRDAEEDAPAICVRTSGPEETEELGRILGEAAFPGAVLLLEGPLGAGKTALTRGVGRALGVARTVTSPTFAILAVHEGRLTLFHVDLYRTRSAAELRAVDLDELFDSGGVTVVEWPRWLRSSPPPGALEVELSVAGPEARDVALRARDGRWAPVLSRVAGRLDLPRRAGARGPAA